MCWTDVQYVHCRRKTQSNGTCAALWELACLTALAHAWSILGGDPDMADESRRKRIEAEMLVAGSAVLIGVCALAVSLYEAALMREQQRSEVLPILELSRSYYTSAEGAESDQIRLTLQATNVGIGPARVRDFRVTVDGKPQPTWNAAMQALLGRSEPVRYGQSSINGRTIPPDHDITMFELTDAKLAADILDQFNRLDYEACFCSVFDECWTTKYSTLGVAQASRNCRHSDESFQA
jgi:hypothetical protein